MSGLNLTVTDMNDVEITAGKNIVYPVRSGSIMKLKKAEVVGVESRTCGQGQMEVFARIITSSGRRSVFKSFKRCAVVG